MLKSVFYLLTNSGMSSFFGLMVITVAAHKIPEKELGVGVTFVMLASFAALISNLGVNTAIIHFLSKTKNRSKLISFCILFTVSFTLTISLVFLFFVQFFLNFNN